jgi:hypothetical protein
MLALRPKTLASLLLVAIVAALGYVGSASAQDTGQINAHAAILLGANQVPAVGDLDGFGFAGISLNPAQGRICWVISASGIEPATAASLHYGEVGVVGDVVFDLTPPSGELGNSIGCTVADPALIADIAADPTNYYVNIYSAEFPSGALRGQLND